MSEHSNGDEKASGEAKPPSVPVMSRLTRQQVASVFVYWRINIDIAAQVTEMTPLRTHQ
jgi:hypothetical protein